MPSNTEITAAQLGCLVVGTPRNRFAVPRESRRALPFARSIGATPVLSIADHLKAKNIPFEFHSLFAGGSPAATGHLQPRPASRG